MNKYAGFYELKSLNIPTVPWERFQVNTILDRRYLWTIRAAVENGNDLGLPRAVGVMAEEAYMKGMEFLRKFGDTGLVIYYPYFIAEKSGVIDISSGRTVVEGVKGDLWNLVSHGVKDVTVIIEDTNHYFRGEKDFLSEDEMNEILGYSNILRGRYRNILTEGKSLMLEWSYAFKSDINNRPTGDRYLVFYEMRAT